ncbi:MAG TPA: sulfotransferase [bacterium]
MTPSLITPVFVVGAGHSGTTIVYRMLSLHPDTAWISQYAARALAARDASGPLLAGIDRMLRGLIAHSWKKSQYPWARRIAPMPIEAHRVWAFALDEQAGRDAAVGRIQAVITRQCRRDGARVFLAKPPGKYRSRCAPLVAAAFPGARFIHVVRDGRAVALSVLEKYRQNGGNQEDPVRRATRHWIRALEQVRTYAALLPVHVMRYEALCADVHGQMRAALAFSGLAVDAFPFDRCPPTLVPTNAGRIDAASGDELQTITAALSAHLREYGYAVGA